MISLFVNVGEVSSGEVAASVSLTAAGAEALRRDSSISNVRTVEVSVDGSATAGQKAYVEMTGKPGQRVFSSISLDAPAVGARCNELTVHP